jgi:hypothetical protein
MTVFVVSNGGRVARLGVAATRKLGPAIDRNRVKRLTREMFRRHKLLEGLDVVVVPRREMLDALFHQPLRPITVPPSTHDTVLTASRRPRRRGAPRRDSARIR